MSGFSADWLSLREPYDHQARDSGLLSRVARLAAARALAGEPVRIIDLACGTGSTARAMAGVVPGPQAWRLIDHDPVLLAEARRQTAGLHAVVVDTATADLASDPAVALVEPYDLVVTSAFLDLVSAAWIGRLADALARARKPFYAALTYDGRAAFAPDHRLDGEMIDAFNRHQRTDKGFGPAAGPDGAAATIAAFETRGFTVEYAQSDWRFGPTDQAIQRPMIDGWATAAREIGLAPETVDAWAAARHAAIESGQATMMVGHVDVFAHFA